MNKETLINALEDYSLSIQIDPQGDVTSRVNATNSCRDYARNNPITKDWVKSNWGNILPAIKQYRKTLKNDIYEAKINNEEERLANLRAELNDLQPYFLLLKPFAKFFA